MISTYSIEKLPTIIVTGEINKVSSLKELWPKIGQTVSSTFVLRTGGAPYLEVKTGKIRGKVIINLIDDIVCTNCYDVKQHLSILSGLGLSVSSTATMDKNSATAQVLINKYAIKLIPTIVLTGDLAAYSNLADIWSEVGTVEKDGAHVFRDGVKLMGTYRDLSTNKIVIATSTQ